MANTELIKIFYQSFAKADVEGMIGCYAEEIFFKDPAFGELRGNDAKNMWRMLIQNSKGKIEISFSDVVANEKTGSANWTAKYVFSQTGRTVVNKISARFEFQDGKIIRHTDHFDFWKWSQQALGWKGYLLGWTLFMKSKIQQQTHILLKKYNASK